MNLGILNYGMGNIQSIKNAINFIDNKIKISFLSKPSDLQNIDKVILPGVGAFPLAMELLNQKNWKESLHNEAQKGTFILGICLGMQLLANKSFEYGETQGLGLIPGEVKQFYPSKKYRIPHMGWNNVDFVKPSFLFDDLENKSDFYFVHSYVFDSINENVSGISYHGEKFPSVVQKDNVIGTQFHPEKSQKAGLQLLKNFLKI
tara:strand:+ start:19878 stop:20489 length:612 start_codon:yes stop_codon:yes gene_type:complete